MSNYPLSHAQRVCRLYKRAIRNINMFWNTQREECRYRSVVMRARFDANKDIKDYRIAKQLVEDGELEVTRTRHKTHPLAFPTSRGGTSFDRVDYPPDYLVDNWHPLEKAAYPKYFAKRELRKMEYVERWQKKYGGKPPPPDVETS